MLRSLAIAALLALSPLACDEPGGADSSAARPIECADFNESESVRFETGRALIDTGDDSVIIGVEIAASSEQRQLGLMNREELPDDCGMAFLFFQEVSSGFWMKNTLIPLSIAFFDEEGTIVKILDMEPCESDPCHVYEPGVSYWGALEVNQGAFEEWNVEEGDRITIPS